MIEAGTVILTFFNIPSICVRFHKNILKVVVFKLHTGHKHMPCISYLV